MIITDADREYIAFVKACLSMQFLMFYLGPLCYLQLNLASALARFHLLITMGVLALLFSIQLTVIPCSPKRRHAMAEEIAALERTSTCIL